MKLERAFVVCCCLLLAFLPGPATGAESKAQPSPAKSGKTARKSPKPYAAAIVVDAASGRVLFEDAADAIAYPASLLKLMDLLIILEKIDTKQLSLQDRVPISAKAANTLPSSVWLQPGESFPVEELLFALMVRSANDAAVALAEKIAGSTDAFVGLMNKRAKELGMNSTEFTSVNGLPPTPGKKIDVTTARDLILLCREVLKHPQALRYTSERHRVFRPNAGKRTVDMWAHNHLLGKLEGCDGLKTGYTARAGFCIAVSAVRQGQRVVAVVMGSPDAKTRDNKAAELVNHSFAALGLKPGK